jgi:FkbM family methyltransferase
MKKKSPQPFISFAQNYEGVILWRALKHVKKGFYIDVGAAWPEEHSVTKAFYDRGWHGINIEPNPIHFLSLKKKRERDINLQIAVGECESEQQMNFIGNTGLSTLDKDIATRHKIDGWGVESATVNVQPLSRIISSNIPAVQDIHFLKVDIKGF